ncbi:MAG: condensation domain-containing protein [Cyanobacteria bacterium P01_F01_bin.4]
MGAGLALGYLNRPELTADKFIANPLSADPNVYASDRLYRTGDLARWLPNGQVECLGRLDYQVKIRGFRIELGAVETALGRHPQIKEAIVVAREDEPGHKRLVAYLVTTTSLSPSELRRHLKVELPDYMVPSAFVFLAALPLTPNGKVDRRALPAPEGARADLDVDYVAPHTAIEKTLADIWADILRVDQVGIHDNFFELGGESILSIQIIARANQAGLKLTTQQIFQHQTIAGLATVAGTVTSIQSEQGPVTGAVPLTPIQSWFLEQQLAEPHYFNQAFLLEVTPDVKPDLLKQSVQQWLSQHDALRLRFVQNESTWQQVNAGIGETFPFTVVDLSGVDLSEQQATIEATAVEKQASLDLAQGPLLQAVLFKLGINQPGRLLLVIHHLAVDGVSWRILLEDLVTAYQQLDQGNPIQLPAKTTSFKAWANQLVGYAHSDTLAAEWDAWLAAAAPGCPSLPVDYPSGREGNTVGSVQTVSVALSEAQTHTLLKEVPQVYNTQINDVLLTALVQSFAEWTREQSLHVNLEGHGREELFDGVDLSRTVGWFTSLFPVALRLDHANQLGDALKAVKEQLRRVPNRGIGYGILRYLSQDPTLRSRLQTLSPPEVSFNYLGQFDQMLSAPPILGWAKELIGSARSPLGRRCHLLEVDGFVAGGRLCLEWRYSEKVHRQETVVRLAESFLVALQALITHCQSPESGGYTPSDFSAASIDQQQLDKLLAKIQKTD